MVALLASGGSFWLGVLVLAVLAIVDLIYSARRAREEHEAALRRIPVVRKRGRAGRHVGRVGGLDTPEGDEAAGVSSGRGGTVSR